jgi:hypothetical protein
MSLRRATRIRQRDDEVVRVLALRVGDDRAVLVAAMTAMLVRGGGQASSDAADHATPIAAGAPSLPNSA